MPEDTASPQPERSRGPFRALRHTSFRRFWLAQFVSLIGTFMQGLGLRWLVYELTGSQALIGLVAAFGGLPMAAFGPFGGVIADRKEKRRIIIAMQSTAGFLALGLWQLTARKWVRVWHVIVLALCTGLVSSVEMPARQSFWVELVGREDLMSAITLNSSIVNLSRIFGPSVAGLLIARVGTATCFLLNAFSFLAPIGVLFTLPRSPVDRSAHRPVLTSLREGLSYVRHTPAVRNLLLLVASWSLFGAQFDVLLPVMADREFQAGARGYGFLAGAMGLGAIAGLLTTASWERRGRRGGLVVAGASAALLGVASLSFMHIYVAALVSMVVIGFGSAMMLTTTNTLVQTRAPDELRGRVMGVYAVMFMGLMPLGSLFYGFVGHALGSVTTLRLGATFFTSLGAVLLLHDHRIRRLR